MSLLGRSLLDINQLKNSDVEELFSFSKKLKQLKPLPLGHKVLGLLFFEPSTRTRASFEMASHLIGVKSLSLDPSQSSITKGETIEDTALTLQALGAHALVMRHSSPGISEKLSELLKIPVINAGDGQRGHPTQALLDAFTILEERGAIVGEKVLLVGDVKYSRVARSNIQLLKKLGAEVAVCSPSTLKDPYLEGVYQVANLEEGLRWATVCMMLRMQVERQMGYEVPSLKEYSRRFGINAQRLKLFTSKGILMHPGPFNRGVELAPEILEDPRNRILAQVKNGVFVRAALLSRIMGVDMEGMKL